MGFKLAAGKREAYRDTSDRLERACNVLFALYRSQAYIGRGWQHLVLLIQGPMRQQSSQILFHFLNICGDRLVVSYRKAFKILLEKL